MKYKIKYIVAGVVVITVLITTINYKKFFGYHIENLTLGSSYGTTGVEGDLKYSFKFPHSSSIQNTIDKIYFKGDTLCFAFDFYGLKEDQNVEIYFIHKGSKKRFKPERIDRQGENIRGFSLVGSLLESFKIEKLDNNWIDIRLLVVFKNKDTHIESSIFNSFFVNVDYIN